MIGQALSHYKILAKLGAGGMGEVYLAEDTKLERRVALKVLPEAVAANANRLQRFEREARTLAALVHPNIVTIFAVEDTVPAGSDHRLHFLAMELVEGETLSEVLEKGSLSQERFFEIAIPLSDAIAAAHERGVIHRDLKPGNVMLTKDGRVKVLDFGLAKLLSTEVSEDSGKATMFMTREGEVVGTYPYMSPEQVGGQAVGFRSDLFSLGVLFYEMATGSRPFPGHNPATLIAAILRDQPAPWSQVRPDFSRELESLVGRCLQKDPKQRVQTAAKIRDQLKDLRRRLSAATAVQGEVTQASRASTSTTSEAERRQLTVMSCNLKELVKLSTRLDAEDLQEVIEDYQRLCAEKMAEFDGYIAQQTGAGTLVYFGYPVAHEDDAQQAVKAAIALVRGVRELNTRHSGVGDLVLAASVGIHTGVTVVGALGGGSGGPLAVGETPNIAIAAETVAAPDGVAITEATSRLVSDRFECRDLGPQRIEGLPRPVRLFEVIGERRAPDRFGRPAHRTRAVGRDTELRLLEDSWATAREGSGRTVLLSGEPGVGKTRLIQLLRDRMRPAPGLTIECRCSAHHQSSSLYPWNQYLREVLGVGQEDSDVEILHRLEALVESRGYDRQEMVGALASVLSLPLPDEYTEPHLNPRRQREGGLHALLNWVCQSGEQEPTLVIFEDLQWADPTSLELLAMVVEQVPAVPVLAVLSFRPEFVPPWQTDLTRIRLEGLMPPQIRSMITSLTGGRDLPPELVSQIVTQTDGVPLFVEELTKAVLESGLLREEDGAFELDGSIGSLAIPGTLQSSLMARLDRLGSAKRTGQLGATVGRTFTYEMLSLLCELDDRDLQSDLRALIGAELLQQRGVPPKATYTFRHALIQDTAYHSLLRKTRKQYHARLAEIIEEHFSAAAETHPELLAHHATEAGLVEKAMSFWRKAAERAMGRWANQEAVAHLEQELKLLDGLPESPEKLEQELSLLMMLSPAQMNLKGFAAPEVEAAYLRARRLCEPAGETPRSFAIIRGLWGYYLVRGDLNAAHELAQDMLRRSEALGGGTSFVLEATRCTGTTLFTLGDFEGAKEYLDRALELYDPIEHASHVALYGLDPGVIGGCFRGMTDWYLGHPDRAIEELEHALQLAEERAHPFSSAFALNMASMTTYLRREPEATERHVAKAIPLAAENGFAVSSAWGRIYRGWIAAEAGDTDRGIEEMREGVAAHRGTGAELAEAFYLAPLAETLFAVGKVDEALTIVDEALAVANRNHEGFYEADLLRLRGEFLAVKASGADGELHQEAEASMRKSLAVARRQMARSLELRALMTLSRYSKRVDDRVGARSELEQVVRSFSEGLDTRDLKDAKALLADPPETGERTGR